MKQLSSWEVNLPWVMDFFKGQEYILAGEATFDDLLDAVVKGEVQVLYQEEPKLIMLTEIVQYPKRRVLRILAVIGKGLVNSDPSELEDWARKRDVEEIEGWCQAPQARLFRRLGYETRYTVVRKSLRSH